MLVILIALGGLGTMLLTLAGLRWWSARAVEDPSLDGEDLVTNRLALLPEGHRPPAGLSPLSPSERFLSQEASRGLRELQEYLAQTA